LLGVLLTFAPGALYPPMAHHGRVAVDSLADQSVGRLMMLRVCPVSYLVAAVVITSHWLLSSGSSPRGDEGGKVA